MSNTICVCVCVFLFNFFIIVLLLLFFVLFTVSWEIPWCCFAGVETVREKREPLWCTLNQSWIHRSYNECVLKPYTLSTDFRLTLPPVSTIVDCATTSKTDRKASVRLSMIQTTVAEAWIAAWDVQEPLQKEHEQASREWKKKLRSIEQQHFRK